MAVDIALLIAGDIASYRALMLEAYAVAPDAFTSTPEERAAEPDSWWAKRLADPAGLTASFGAFQDGELVGTVALEFAGKPKTQNKGHLIGMFVNPVARGSGAGRKLVQEAIEFARGKPGVEVLTHTVNQGNAPAQRLYESCGFKVFGVEPMAIRGEAGYLSKVHMWLQLHGAEGAA